MTDPFAALAVQLNEDAKAERRAREADVNRQPHPDRLARYSEDERAMIAEGRVSEARKLHDSRRTNRGADVHLRRNKPGVPFSW